jgi:hypothetical protein
VSAVLAVLAHRIGLLLGGLVLCLVPACDATSRGSGAEGRSLERGARWRSPRRCWCAVPCCRAGSPCATRTGVWAVSPAAYAGPGLEQAIIADLCGKPALPVVLSAIAGIFGCGRGGTVARALTACRLHIGFLTLLSCTRVLPVPAAVGAALLPGPGSSSTSSSRVDAP